MAEFTHLHLHTDYSLLDGACDVEKLVDRVANIGQKAVAMTDHGNIYGAVHFFDAAEGTGIKPILGCELYICQKDDHRAEPQGDDYNHLLVLAENEEGYRNLVRITCEASLHGFYRKPRVSKKYLAEHSAGLIGFSGCLAGELCENLMEGKYEAARATAGAVPGHLRQRQLLPRNSGPGPRARKEDPRRSLPAGARARHPAHRHQRQPLRLRRRLARARNPALRADRSARINDPKRFKFDTEQFYVKSAEEMEQLFSHAPEVCSRTMQFAERCKLKLTKVDNPFPEFAVPAGQTIDSYFDQVCREGLKKRLETAVAPPARSRHPAQRRSPNTRRASIAKSASSSR